MRKYVFIIFLFISTVIFGCTKTVLFIGNSYTFYNNLPDLISRIAESLGDTLIYETSTPGGYSLYMHSTYEPTLSLLRSRRWDYVILQDQSQMPTIEYLRETQSIIGLRVLDSLCDYNCSLPVMYATWGRRFGGIQCIDIFCSIAFEDFEEMTDTLEAVYFRFAQMSDAILVPVGRAFVNAKLADETINLWDADNSHPSVEGSYLGACIFYAIMFDKAYLRSSFFHTLDSETCLFLQNIASETFLEMRDVCYEFSPVPNANFSVEILENTVFFTNLCENATFFEWNFDDGSASYDNNPVHYFENGVYNVSLIAQNSCFIDTMIIRVDIAESSSIYENSSTTEKISLSYNLITLNDYNFSPASIEIFSLTGKQVFEKTFSKNCKIELLNCETGIYFVVLRTSNEYYYKKILLIDGELR